MSGKIMKIGLIFEFDAAHKLPHLNNKCKNLHGHTYKVEIQLKGELINGMVIDFHDFKRDIQFMIDRLDHSYLNDIVLIPTAENICEYIYNRIPYKDKITKLQVWESSNTYAEISF